VNENSDRSQRCSQLVARELSPPAAAKQQAAPHHVRSAACPGVGFFRAGASL